MVAGGVGLTVEARHVGVAHRLVALHHLSQTLRVQRAYRLREVSVDRGVGQIDAEARVVGQYPREDWVLVEVGEAVRFTVLREGWCWLATPQME